MDPTEKNKGFLIGILAESEEQVARALEAFSRPIAGLVLDGIMITIIRNDMDEDESP